MTKGRRGSSLSQSQLGALSPRLRAKESKIEIIAEDSADSDEQMPLVTKKSLRK
jgi:hypothetical protein